LTGGLLYLDSSAIIKLVVAEPESAALLGELGAWPETVSSALARLEVLRAIRRSASGESVSRRAHAVLERIGLVRIDDAILEKAASLEPPALRSLDAIHLATALSLGSDLGAIAAYDLRLARAARALGLRVVSP
jgi:uncharacterized protein